ncbi:MAG: hypothetical protein IPP74_00165 [Alphaproteobacteria bacterium]|nr:hypothetical protein [Alphaproteobacteria bacterium]
MSKTWDSNPVVREARTWIGTRFLHQGRSKKTSDQPGGCDCLGLVIGVCKSLGIQSLYAPHPFLCELDNPNYGFIHSQDQLSQVLDLHLLKHDGKPYPGAIGLFAMANYNQHVGIFSDYPSPENVSELGLIHCHIRAGGVVEHRYDESWQSRCKGVYRL